MYAVLVAMLLVLIALVVVVAYIIVVVVTVLIALLIVRSLVFATLGAVSPLAVRSIAIFFFATVLATVLMGGAVLLIRRR